MDEDDDMLDFLAQLGAIIDDKLMEITDAHSPCYWPQLAVLQLRAYELAEAIAHRAVNKKRREEAWFWN